MQTLRVAAGRSNAGIVLLRAGDGSFGTGFVISRKRRLVVTAGHVADSLLRDARCRAFPNGALPPRMVNYVWYHPRAERFLDGSVPVRSANPADGPIISSRFDIAVVQLAPSGPELEAEWNLATTDEVAGVRDRLLGCLSYSGENLLSRTATSIAVPAEFSSSRAAPPSMVSTDPAIGSVPEINFNHRNPDGGSGSPIFLPNGHVVGVLTESRITSRWAMVGGPNANRVRELLAYHGLDCNSPDLVAARVHGSVPDAAASALKLEAADRCIRDAELLRRAGQYSATVEQCNHVRRFLPDYAGVFFVRGKAYLYYLANNWRLLSDSARKDYAKWASDDMRSANACYPQLKLIGLTFIQSIIYFAHFHDDRGLVRIALEQIDWDLDPGWST